MSTFSLIVYELGVIFEGHLAPLPKQFATSPQVRYISMILMGPYEDIFMPLKFVWGGCTIFRNLAALQKLAQRLKAANLSTEIHWKTAPMKISFFSMATQISWDNRKISEC